MDYQLDLKRLLCPLPVIRVQDKIKTLNAGDRLTVFCTDPGTLHDIPAWCRVHKHEIINIEQELNIITIIIEVK